MIFHFFFKKHEKTYQYLELLGGVPAYLCLLFIAMRFGVLLFLEVRQKWLKSTREVNGHIGSPA
jgi:hypothetical protein